MNVAFRTDAALHIGTGHVMRCLTLANALRMQGAECLFVCREFQGHLHDEIRRQGHGCVLLPERDVSVDTPPNEQSIPPHAVWLGVDWEEDAAQTTAALGGRQFEWLIVDHYALDARWERAVGTSANKVMVIDDLADRSHACDLLLDQTLGRNPDDYGAHVPAGVKLLCGSQYVLLRPEFAAWRDYSLARREGSPLRKLLVNLGGVDVANITGKVLEELAKAALPEGASITVVMGSSAPHLKEVSAQAARMQVSTVLIVNASNMAELMANSDLAIGAAGTTSWERCCLGLPTLMIVLAPNQAQVAHALQAAGAAWYIEDTSTILCAALCELVAVPSALWQMSQCASRLVNGVGVNVLAAVMESMCA